MSEVRLEPSDVAADVAIRETTPGPGGGPIEREFTIRSRSQSRLILRRFLRHRLAIISLIILIGIILLSLVGGRLWHYKFAQLTTDYSKHPSWKHPMGTDGIGHDTFAQILRGAQKSVEVALMVAGISTVIGTTIGAIAGYYGGRIDNLLMRFVDLILTVPSIAVLAVLANVAKGEAGTWYFVGIVIALIIWTYIARVVRGQFLSLREKEFVEAARALGASDARIIARHLLPNAAGAIIVNATLAVANAILLETALSYLGLGIRPPDTSLGLLVSDGQQAATTRPWLFYFPGLFIIIICLTVNFVGDGLRDAFDPTQTRVRA